MGAAATADARSLGPSSSSPHEVLAGPAWAAMANQIVGVVIEPLRHGDGRQVPCPPTSLRYHLATRMRLMNRQ